MLQQPTDKLLQHWVSAGEQLSGISPRKMMSRRQQWNETKIVEKEGEMWGNEKRKQVTGVVLTWVIWVIALYVRLLLLFGRWWWGSSSPSKGLVQFILTSQGVHGSVQWGGTQGARPAKRRGRCRGDTPWVAGEVVRDLLDGLDGARAHINGHVLLDADGGLLAFTLCHACGPSGMSAQTRHQPRNETKSPPKANTSTSQKVQTLQWKKYFDLVSLLHPAVWLDLCPGVFSFDSPPLSSAGTGITWKVVGWS